LNLEMIMDYLKERGEEELLLAIRSAVEEHQPGC